MSEDVKEAIMQFQTAIDLKESPMPMNYNINIKDTKVLLNYIEQLQQENKDLKNKQNKFEKDYKEMIEIQGQDGNYNYDSYMLGLYNGMEYIISLYENREPIYRSGKDVNFLHENNILTEFEKWLKKCIAKLYNKIYVVENDKLSDCAEYLTLMSCLDKLQELKGGKK